MNTTWNNAYQNQPYVVKEPHSGVVNFINQLAKEKRKRILDLGCGDGRHLIFLAEQGCLPVGVDHAIWGLRRALEWAEKAALPIQLIHADIRCLPFQAESFDQVISIQVIHHQTMVRIEETVAGVRRLLHTGGYFYFTVPKYPPGNWKDNKYLEIEPHTFVPQAGFEKGIPHHFFTTDELGTMLASFEIIEITEDAERHLSALVRKVK